MNKRSKDIVICIFIVTSMIFSMLLLTNNSVQAATFDTLEAGDSLLYNVDAKHFGWDNHTVYVEQKNEIESSHKDNHYYEDLGTETHSYSVTSVDQTNENLNANHTTSFYSKSSYWYDEFYDYDYNTDNWILHDQMDYSDEYQGNWSDQYESEWCEYNASLINLDPMDMFYNADYVDSFSKSYMINGIATSININHYQVTDNRTWSYTEYWRDIELSVDEQDSMVIDYFVDADLGYLIELRDYHKFETYRYGFNYSAELGSNVEVDEKHIWEDDWHWELFETNAAYSPVIDADLPTMIHTYPWLVIDNTTDQIYIDFNLYDSSNDMLLKIYIDDYYHYATEYNVTNGFYNYSINVAEIPYDGPYMMHNIKFVLYDSNNLNHNTTWNFDVEDQRFVQPEWSSWIEGPDYLQAEPGKHLDVEYKVYSDTEWYVEIYRIRDWGEEYWWRTGGYKNETFWLNHPPEPEGIYEYKLVFWDTSGEYINKTVTVEVKEDGQSGEDTIAPNIEGPGPDVYIKQGQNETINYKITDENPGKVKITKNGAVILDEPMSSKTHYIYLDVSTWALGTYNVTIFAEDSYGNVNEWHLVFYVTESGDDPGGEDDDGSGSENTLELDGPNYVIIGLSVLSLASLAFLSKRRN